jgi:hypothetical protein
MVQKRTQGRNTANMDRLSGVKSKPEEVNSKLQSALEECCMVIIQKTEAGASSASAARCLHDPRLCLTGFFFFWSL